MRASIHTLCGLAERTIDACLAEALVHVRPSDARDTVLWSLTSVAASKDERRDARAKAWRSVRRNADANAVFQRMLVREVCK